jgi:hypothetical protein
MHVPSSVHVGSTCIRFVNQMAKSLGILTGLKWLRRATAAVGRACIRESVCM